MNGPETSRMSRSVRSNLDLLPGCTLVTFSLPCLLSSLPSLLPTGSFVCSLCTHACPLPLPAPDSHFPQYLGSNITPKSLLYQVIFPAIGPQFPWASVASCDGDSFTLCSIDEFGH